MIQSEKIAQRALTVAKLLMYVTLGVGALLAYQKAGARDLLIVGGASGLAIAGLLLTGYAHANLVYRRSRARMIPIYALMSLAMAALAWKSLVVANPTFIDRWGAVLFTMLTPYSLAHLTIVLRAPRTDPAE